MKFVSNKEIQIAKEKYCRFIFDLRKNDCDFKLSPTTEISPYARCFAIFGLNLIQETAYLVENKKLLVDSILRDLQKKYGETKSKTTKPFLDKPFMQLLAFSLSALSIVEPKSLVKTKDLVTKICPTDIQQALQEINAADGAPKTGNLAMFLAIMLIYIDKIDNSRAGDIEKWTSYHLESMNLNGFWGDFSTINFLQFQNGYHQYEIFEALNIRPPLENNARTNVASLVGKDNHFAPYPGGGGCYDYDAAFILTFFNETISADHRLTVANLAETILNEQNVDGGFCENKCVRPRNFAFFTQSLRGLFANNLLCAFERFKYFIAIQRPKNNNVHTHWTQSSRGWNESNLWDSWFRMLCVARVDCCLNPGAMSHWSFINFPGIGSRHIQSKVDTV